jgi:hypothetical protein
MPQMLVGLAFLLATLSACSRSTDLSGDVFVTMRSGDVKRGADVEVALIPATPAFESDWASSLAKFQKDYADAQTTYKAWQAEEERARQQSDASGKRLSAASLSGSFSQRLDEYSRASDKWINATTETRGAATALAEVVRRHGGLAMAVIAKHKDRIARTDVNGHYAMRGIRRGKYYLFARQEVFENRPHWFVPVELNAGDMKTDLSGSNSGWPFDPPRS